MERPALRGHRFVCSGADPAVRANRLERLDIFFDDHSRAATFGLQQAKAEGVED